MRYYIIKGRQLGEWGSWMDADLQCEASSPVEARAIFDKVFQSNGIHDNKARVVTSMVEDTNWRGRGGLEPE